MLGTNCTVDAQLARWVDTFRGPLVGLIASWGLTFGEADELAQDTFAEAWLSRQHLRATPDDLAAVGAWLRGIARNLVRAARRAKRRARADGDAVVDALPASDPPPEDDRMALLTQAFARLSRRHQTILRMHYLEATTARTVAALLGTSLRAVESQLYHARRGLRKHIDHLARTQERGVMQ